MMHPAMIRAVNTAGALQQLIDDHCPEEFGDIVCEMEAEWFAQEGDEGDASVGLRPSSPDDFIVHNLYDLPTHILEEKLEELQAEYGPTGD